MNLGRVARLDMFMFPLLTGETCSPYAKATSPSSAGEARWGFRGRIRTV
jgi:hypothetical protein